MYVANSVLGWGRSHGEYGAVANMLGAVSADFDDGLQVTIYELDGFEAVNAAGVEADEIHSKRVVELQADDMERVRDLSRDLERATEEALVNGEEITE